MDLNTIFAALQQADAAAQQSSPFKPFTDTTDAVSKLLVTNAPQYGMGENLAAGLITGLLGGFSSRLTDQFRQEQSDLASSLFQNIMNDSDNDSSDLVRPEGMSPSVFSTLRNSGSLFKLAREMEIKDEVRKAAQAASANLLQKGLRVNSETGQMEMVPGAAEAIGALTRAERGATSIPGFGDIPPALVDDTLKADALRQQNDKAIEFVKDQFNQAREVSGLGAFLDPGRLVGAEPLLGPAKKLGGIQNAIMEAYQRTRGSEINDAVRRQMMALVPQATDTDAVLDDKLARMIDLFRGSERSPIALSLMGGNKPKESSKFTESDFNSKGDASGAKGIPPGAVKTGRTAGGKPVYIVDGKLWVED